MSVFALPGERPRQESLRTPGGARSNGTIARALISTLELDSDHTVFSMAQVLDVADELDLRVAFEPEPGNVINASVKARRLLDELASDRLGVVIDAVNTMETAPDRPAEAVLDEAFDLLGDRIFVAHAKDHDEAGREVTTGSGIVSWPYYVSLLRAAGFAGPLIIHGVQEDEVAASAAYLGSIIG